ncbi:SPTB2 protein, partial [Urocolius indicus]|nr:SPTB2 protein [Urocolius indicus]
GYQPCEPAAVRQRVAALELQYQQLLELSRRRRARLEESRRFWKFCWDAEEEEAWMREQERLLSCEDVGRDLSSSLRLLSQHAAWRGELSGRAGPLRQALAGGELLVAEGSLGAPEVARRLKELEERWEALGKLEAERELRLRRAAAAFQLQAEAADAEAWLEDAARLVTGPELGHDEFSTRSLVKQHRDVQEDVRSHGRALEALKEQAAALAPQPATGAAAAAAAAAVAKLPQLEARYREVSALAERRSRELQDALSLYTMCSEANACELWLGEKEQWLAALRVPDRLEDLEVVQQRFERLEPELNGLASRVAAVSRVAEQLLGTGRRNRDSVCATRQQLNARWERFRALCDQKKEALTSALSIQNFHLECDETSAWVQEKTKAIESTQGLGSDLPGVTALQRKLSGLEHDLEAIQTKVRELRAQGEDLSSRHPQQSPALLARLEAVEAARDELRLGLRLREEALGESKKLQAFLRDLAGLQAWLSQTQAAAASRDLPATPAEAERLLSQHESLRREIERYGDDYRGAGATGKELVERNRGQGQLLLLQQRLEALDKGWEQLGWMWEERQRLLAEALAFQLFLRDSKQVEGVLSRQ